MCQSNSSSWGGDEGEECDVGKANGEGHALEESSSNVGPVPFVLCWHVIEGAEDSWTRLLAREWDKFSSWWEVS